MAGDDPLTLKPAKNKLEPMSLITRCSKKCPDQSLLPLLWSIGLSLFLVACASTPDNPHFQTMSEGEITGIIENNTQNRKIYDGFMNNLDVSATLTTTEVGRALTDQGAKIYQWDAQVYANEKSKAETLRASETEMFFSFFVPERKWDDLHKEKSNWKIFLDAGGKRYQGKAARWKAQPVEVKSFYPHHTRWGTPYKVTFPVPIRDIENTTSRLTLTGPVGTVTMDFAPDGTASSQATPAISPGPSSFDTAPVESEPVTN